MNWFKAAKSSKLFLKLCLGITNMVMLVALEGCHSLGGLGHKSVELKIDDRLNPDDLGRPLSMVVRLYELKNREAFDALGLAELANAPDDQALVSKDLLVRHEFLLTPGAHRTIEWKPDSRTRYFAWVGLYRNPRALPWRVVLSADDISGKPGTLKIGPCGLQWLAAGSALPNKVEEAQEAEARLTCLASSLATGPEAASKAPLVAPIKPAPVRPLRRPTQRVTKPVVKDAPPKVLSVEGEK
ncbi:MAG: type VI secretion system lipoprotein TssJ [Burkholderiales bacterium]|jgi:type VI secretion system protein VasD|nr:type VI secretion system lipoprotein TssJ [Burkholderiales bacterium]